MPWGHFPTELLLFLMLWQDGFHPELLPRAVPSAGRFLPFLGLFFEGLCVRFCDPRRGVFAAVEFWVWGAADGMEIGWEGGRRRRSRKAR
jgi:hypothetical protein